MVKLLLIQGRQEILQETNKTYGYIMSCQQRATRVKEKSQKILRDCKCLAFSNSSGTVDHYLDNSPIPFNSQNPYNAQTCTYNGHQENFV